MIIHLKTAIMNLKDSFVNHNPVSTIRANIRNVMQACGNMLKTYGKSGPVANEIHRIQDNTKFIWNNLARVDFRNKNSIYNTLKEKIEEIANADNRIVNELQTETSEAGT